MCTCDCVFIYAEMCVSTHQLFVWTQRYINTHTKQTTSTKQKAQSRLTPFMSITKQPGEHMLQHAWLSQVTVCCSPLCTVGNLEYTLPHHIIVFTTMQEDHVKILYFVFCFSIWFLLKICLLFCLSVSILTHCVSFCGHLTVCISLPSPVAPHSLSHLCIFQVF